MRQKEPNDNKYDLVAKQASADIDLKSTKFESRNILPKLDSIIIMDKQALSNASGLSEITEKSLKGKLKLFFAIIF